MPVQFDTLSNTSSCQDIADSIVGANIGGVDFSKFTLKKTVASATIGEYTGATTSVKYTPGKECNAILFIYNTRLQYGHIANMNNLGYEICSVSGSYGKMFAVLAMNSVTEINGSFYAANDSNHTTTGYCYIYTDE